MYPALSYQPLYCFLSPSPEQYSLHSSSFTTLKDGARASLDHVITNRDDIPPIGRSFSVDNEAEWREYCESEGEKKNYSGWYQFEQR